MNLILVARTQQFCRVLKWGVKPKGCAIASGADESKDSHSLISLKISWFFDLELFFKGPDMRLLC